MSHTTQALLVIAFVLCIHPLFVSSAECPTTGGCSNCTKTSGCGWCAATQTCLSGSASGPEQGTCRGSWQTTCVDCSAQKACLTCLGNLDCVWCATSVNPTDPQYACKSVEDATANPSTCPSTLEHCPCIDYNTCHECSAVPGCTFCDTGSCNQQGHCNPVTCDCHNYPTCTTCNDDPACGWCYGSNICVPEPANCSAETCDVNCRVQLTCMECVSERGCGWCPHLDSCHTIDSSICGGEIQTQCAKRCNTVTDCNLCIDMGLPCEWCPSTRSCVDIAFANNCSTSDSCATEVCPTLGDCGTCLRTPGCAWCHKGKGTCVDIFTNGNCPDHELAHNCSNVLVSGFSLGSFFGGMATMLAIYLLIGICAYFYKRKNPPQHYQEMQ